jgi:hypothetical protein
MYKCVFAPADKVDLLHQTIHEIAHPEEWRATLKGQLVQQIEDQIQILSESHWYFRSSAQKIESLKCLSARIESAHPESTKSDLLAIVTQWESEPVPEITAEKAGNNKELISLHRNRFWAEKRPAVQTATENMLQKLKDILVDQPDISPGI